MKTTTTFNITKTYLKTEQNPTLNWAEKLLIITMLCLPLKRALSLGIIGGPWAITAAKVTIIITFIFWFIRGIILKETNLITTPFANFFNTLIIWYLFISLLSISFSVNPSDSLPVVYRRVAVIALYIIIINIPKTNKAICLMMIAYLISFFIASSAGLYELISGEPVLQASVVNVETYKARDDLMVTPTGSIRIQGLGMDPDINGHMMFVTTGIILGALFSNYLVRGIFKKLLLFILLCLNTVNIIASGSRTAWMSLAISLVVFASLAKLKHKTFIVTSGFLVFIIIIISLSFFTNAPILERIIGKSGNISIEARLNEAKISSAMIRDNPVLGVGPGNIENLYNRYRKVAPSSMSQKLKDVNATLMGYFHICTEIGTLGLICSLLILIAFLRRILYLMKRTSDENVRTMAVGIIAVFSAQVFSLLFYPLFDSEFVWTVYGIGMALSNLNLPKEAQPRLLYERYPCRG